MMRSRRHSIFLLCSIAAVEWELLGKTPPMRLGENIRKLIELAAKQTQWFPAEFLWPSSKNAGKTPIEL